MNSPKLFHDRSEMDIIFVHSELDDRKLSMAEFRVYCHLARRAVNGTAYPGIDSMASVCCMAKNTVIEAIKSLEASNMLVAERRSGTTTKYVLTPKSQWIPLPKMNSDCKDTVAKEGTVRLNSDNATVAKEGTKGNPTKVIQKVVNKFVPPTLEESKQQAVKNGMPESEGEKFFYYYESNGWRVGRNPMKSWPAAMVNWRKNWQERNSGARGYASGRRPPVTAPRANGMPENWKDKLNK